MVKKIFAVVLVLSLFSGAFAPSAAALSSETAPALAPTAFTPVADTYVRAAAPTSNYGTRVSLRADASPVENIYLRFNVQGMGSVPSAALRIYAESGNPLGLNVHTVSNTSWGEGQTTWNNAPQIGPVIANTGAMQAGNWYLVDVSSAVTANGLVSFAITNPSASVVMITSKEGSRPPELLIPKPASPDPFVVSRIGNTYQAVSATTGTIYSGSLKSVVETAAYELNAHGGGTISFQAGDFDLGGEWFEFYDLKNVTFQGQGIDVTILRNNASASTDTEPFDFSNGDYITIRDMTISAGGPFRSTSDALDFDAGDYNLLERIKVTGARGRGIVFDGKDVANGEPRTAVGNVVVDCIVTGVPSDGIELLASSQNRVENCQVTNVGGHGIQITKSSTSASQPNKPSSDNIIIGNYVDNAGQDGINLNSGDRNQILNNTILNSSNSTSNQDGIDISSSNSIVCDDNIVQGNTATDNQAVKTQRYGLSISSSLCHRTVVSGNNFAGNRVGEIRDVGTGTIYSTDNVPPSVPTGLATTLVAYNQVDLVWNASTDNVGVTSYRIYRNGNLLNTVNGATTTYQDTTVAPNTSYNYTVEAFDAANNGSGQSAALPVNTPPAPADNVPPSVPGNLRTTNLTHSAVDLAWDASTDNVGVTSYKIYRDGGLLNTVNGSTTTYQDSTVTPGASYTYTVEAFDAANNGSGPSGGLPVTVPSAPSSFTFVTTADSYVNEASAGSNYGTSSSLRADGSPIVRSYLRFDVQGVSGTITSATLRIFANSASSVGCTAFGVTNNTWTESGLTYTNAPPLGPQLGSSGPVGTGTWITMDVTAFVTGNGTFTLAVTTPHTTAISLASGESSNAPQLIIAASP